MNYINVCQLCWNCKKGSHVYKVELNCFDDESGKVIIDPIKRVHYIFQCQFCFYISILDFEASCPPPCVLQLKKAFKEKKEKMQKLVEQLTTMAFEQ